MNGVRRAAGAAAGLLLLVLTVALGAGRGLAAPAAASGGPAGAATGSPLGMSSSPPSGGASDLFAALGAAQSGAVEEHLRQARAVLAAEGQADRGALADARTHLDAAIAGLAEQGRPAPLVMEALAARIDGAVAGLEQAAHRPAAPPFGRDAGFAAAGVLAGAAVATAAAWLLHRRSVPQARALSVELDRLGALLDAARSDAAHGVTEGGAIAERLIRVQADLADAVDGARRTLGAGGAEAARQAATLGRHAEQVERIARGLPAILGEALGAAEAHGLGALEAAADRVAAAAQAALAAPATPADLGTVVTRAVTASLQPVEQRIAERLQAAAAPPLFDPRTVIGGLDLAIGERIEQAVGAGMAAMGTRIAPVLAAVEARLTVEQAAPDPREAMADMAGEMAGVVAGAAERAIACAAERAIACAAERAIAGAAERAIAGAAERAIELAAERAIELAAERAIERAAERSADAAAHGMAATADGLRDLLARLDAAGLSFGQATTAAVADLRETARSTAEATSAAARRLEAALSAGEAMGEHLLGTATALEGQVLATPDFGESLGARLGTAADCAAAAAARAEAALAALPPEGDRIAIGLEQLAAQSAALAAQAQRADGARAAELAALTSALERVAAAGRPQSLDAAAIAQLRATAGEGVSAALAAGLPPGFADGLMPALAATLRAVLLTELAPAVASRLENAIGSNAADTIDPALAAMTRLTADIDTVCAASRRLLAQGERQGRAIEHLAEAVAAVQGASEAPAASLPGIRPDEPVRRLEMLAAETGEVARRLAGGAAGPGADGAAATDPAPLLGAIAGAIEALKRAATGYALAADQARAA